MEPKVIKNRIKELREAKGWSQTRLAKAIGANKSQVSRLEKGDRGLSEQWIRKIADALGNPPSVILTDDLFYHHYEQAAKPPAPVAEPAPPPTTAPVAKPVAKAAPGGIAQVPVYDAGDYGADARPIGHNPYAEAWLKRLGRVPASDLAVIRISGDASQPTLHHGDEVLVDITVNRWRRDGLYALKYGTDGEVMIKRLAKSPRSHTLSVISDNPDYPTVKGVEDHEITVLGRVIWLGKVVG
jgi:phage repressor protein C with HTH and peptisase S24 domain